MTLADSLRQSARACEGASVALAHALRPTVTQSPNPPPNARDAYREVEAIEITCRAVMEEAATIIPLLDNEQPCVGRSPRLIFDKSRICNGFDTLISILITLLDTTNQAILDVAGYQKSWLVSPIQAAACFEKMVTHHGQLRAFYGIIHLAAKIVNRGNVSKSLFVDVNNTTTDPNTDPIRCRAAIKLDDFYGRGFGFHYSPEMRNVLRVVSIARGSVQKSHREDDDRTPELIRNVAMLGWGMIYSNMVLMDQLGITIEGVSQIGADGDEYTMKIPALRKFMNLVEQPLVAGVSGLASADVTVDSVFYLPIPTEEDGLEGAESDLLQEIVKYVKEPVTVRLMSSKRRPISLPKGLAVHAHPVKPEKSEPIRSSSKTSLEGQSSERKGIFDALYSPFSNSVENISEDNPNATSEGVSITSKTAPSPDKRKYSEPVPLPPDDLLHNKTDSGPSQGNLGDTLRTELIKFHSNVSSFLGREQAKPASGLIIHFHGGGFISQSSTGHMVYMKEWCADVPDTVLFAIDYKLAPEYKYPVALNECTYAYIWALQNASRLGTLANRVIFTGDSAGGNLAIATALNIGRLGVRPPDAIAVAYPSLYVRNAWSPSRLLSFFDPMLPLSVIDLCLKSYCRPEDETRGSTDPLLSPVVASDEELRRLPPICMISGSLDPLLDDAVQFAHRLKLAGRTEDILKIYECLPHGFLNMNQVYGVANSGMRYLSRKIAEYLQVAIRKGSQAGVPDNLKGAVVDAATM